MKYKLIGHHGVIGKPAGEVIYNGNVVTLIDTGEKFVAVNGLTWPVSESDVLADLQNKFEYLIVRFTKLGLTDEQIDKVFTSALDYVKEHIQE